VSIEFKGPLKNQVNTHKNINKKMKFVGVFSENDKLFDKYIESASKRYFYFEFTKINGSILKNCCNYA